jgi:hypothetical protein
MMAAHWHRQLTGTVALISAALISDSEVPVAWVSAAGFTGTGKWVQSMDHLQLEVKGKPEEPTSSWKAAVGSTGVIVLTIPAGSRHADPKCESTF